MAAGAWVFPIGIAGFLVFLTSLLLSTPATPASFLVVKAGDSITYEETAFYGDNYVAWTTREDLLDSGELRVGPYGLIPRPRDLEATLASDAANVTEPFETFLGRRVNESFTTQARDAPFGDWTQNGTVSRQLVELPLDATIRTGQNLGGTVFNASNFARDQSQRLGRPLQVGDQVDCDFGRCEILSFDASQVTYRQLIQNGTRFSVERFVSFPDQEPKPRSQLEVQRVGSDRFEVRWHAVEGDAFILRSTFGSFPPGYYRFGAQTDDAVAVQYRDTEALLPDGSLAPAHLVGERVWFEYTVTRIA